MPTQLTIKRTLKDALAKLDDCRAKLEEAQTDMQELDIEDPDQAEINEALWMDVDESLGVIDQLDGLLANYTG